MGKGKSNDEIQGSFTAFRMTTQQQAADDQQRLTTQQRMTTKGNRLAGFSLGCLGVEAR
jgi:hypothetical protein